jgi:hypothetical protein
MSKIAEWDWTKQPDLKPLGGLGPTLTCVRASIAMTDGYNWGGFDRSSLTRWHPQENFINEPRIVGARRVENMLIKSDTLSDAAWTKLNVTVAKDEIGPRGGANTAWTITDDGTNAAHSIDQLAPTTVNGVRMRGNQQLKVKKGTARYISIAWENPQSANSTWVFDLDLGYWSDVASWQTGYGSGIGEHVKKLTDWPDFFPPDVYTDADGWYIIDSIYHMHNAAAARMTIAFCDGPLYTDNVYVGTGDTVIVADIQLERSNNDLNYAGVGQEVIVTDTVPLAQYFTTKQRVTSAYNGVWAGVSDGSPPDSGLYSYVGYTLVASTGHGYPQSSTIDPHDGTQYEMKEPYSHVRNVWAGYYETTAVRFVGENQRYYFGQNTVNLGALSRRTTYTLSIYVEEVTIEGTEDVISLRNFTGATGQLTAKLSDRVRVKHPRLIGEFIDRIEMTFTMGADSNTAFGIFDMGGGVSGNDTFDFVLAGVQIDLGSVATDYLPNWGFAWWQTNASVFDQPIHDIEGLLCEKVSENLSLQSEVLQSTPWVEGNAVAIGNTGRDLSPAERTIMDHLTDDNSSGVGVVSLTQPVTLAVSTVYTLACASKMADVGNGINWGQLLINGQAALDINVYISPNIQNLVNIGATPGTDNDDEGFYEWPPHHENFRYWLTFTSDAADTTADIVLQLAADDEDDDVPLDDSSDMMFGMVDLKIGKLSSYVMSGATALTRAADVISAALTGPSEGSLFVDFRTEWAEDGTGTDQTIVCFYSGGTNRMTLELVGGSLIFRVRESSTDHAIISLGSIADQTRYRVALGWGTNDAVMFVNDAQVGVQDTSVTIPITDTLNVGSDHLDLEQLGGPIARLKIWDNREPDESLQNMTKGVFPDTSNSFNRSLSRPLQYDTQQLTGE